MLKKIESFIHTQNLFAKTDKLLLAVSGGLDSMTMLHLLHTLKYTIEVAHCNFQLRGNEADKDQNFVKNYCESKNIPFHTINFDTKTYATKQGISIQMAARDLRYDWFEKLMQKHQYTVLCTAHHVDDSIETVLINLSRGTGIKGLLGIQQQSKIKRPILFATRNEIEVFAKNNGVEFREDASNSDTKYLRNKIRHEIVPELKNLNENFTEHFKTSIDQLSQLNQFWKKELNKHKNICAQTDSGLAIDIDLLQKSGLPIELALFEWLSPFGFKNEQINKIATSFNGQSGKIFLSEKHELLKDRKHLIVRPKEHFNIETIQINVSTKSIETPIKLTFETKSSLEKFSSNNNEAYLNLEKIDFPLHLRTWKNGDRFQPFGMKGKVKISDFFVQQKLSLFEKEQQQLLCDAHDSILWVIGFRIDDNFKVISKTKPVYHITLS